MKVYLSSTIAAVALLQIASVNAQTTEAVDNNQDVTTAAQIQETVTAEPQLAQEVEMLTDEASVSLQEAGVGDASSEAVEEMVEEVVEESTEALDDQTMEEEISAIENEIAAIEEEISSIEETKIDQEDTLADDTLIEDEAVSEDDSLVEQVEMNESVIEDTYTELSGEETLGEESDVNPNAYNFERPIRQEGDVYIPILDDAKVFAEFIDSLPAVVNYYTYASEDEVIAFYTENYGEPVEQERKRGRLTVIYYLEDVAIRVVISEQDNYRQVDVLQENAAL